MPRRKDTFRRGQSTFSCECCGRRTRATDLGNVNCCPDCYELAGYENSLSDNGSEYFSESDKAEVRRLAAEAVKHGGDKNKLIQNFETLELGLS